MLCVNVLMVYYLALNYLLQLPGSKMLHECGFGGQVRASSNATSQHLA